METKKTLSFKGRMTLINSVLSFLLLFFLSFFMIPKSVTSKLVKFQRDFLWAVRRGEGRCLG